MLCDHCKLEKMCECGTILMSGTFLGVSVLLEWVNEKKMSLFIINSLLSAPFSTIREWQRLNRQVNFLSD